VKKRFAVRSLATLLGIGALLGVLGAGEPVALKTTEFGQGPTIVLLHALGSGRMVWMPTARKLLAGHHVVMVDLPGHGDSPMPDPFSLQACAEALDRVLAKQKPESTVLVAHGMGGLIALQEVQSHPDRVRGLVVIDAAAKSSMTIPEQQQRYFLSALDTRYAEVMKPIFFRQGRDSAQGEEIYAQAMQVPPANVKAYLAAVMNADASAALKNMKPAFLFIGSERRWPADKDWATLSRELGFPEGGAVQTRRISNCGAFIMKEQPDSLALVLSQFAAKAIAAKK
jgi:pimeloyl-ACP methyl ester carboxylesterase